MKSNHFANRFAVITGASRGIGAEYARTLAMQGYDMLLVARDQARLKELAIELETTHHVRTETEAIDLSQPNSAHQLYSAAHQRNTPIDLLINNAGFGMHGPFADHPLHRIQEMLQLHITTTVESIRLFLPDMIERKTGAIINVSSVAGFFPIPYIAEYAATKAFLITFSEALAEEVRTSNVHIQVCCPGYTKTDFHATAKYTPKHPFQPQTTKEVVEASLRGLKKNRNRVKVGWQGYLSDLVIRYAPRSLLIRMTGKRTKDSIVR